MKIQKETLNPNNIPWHEIHVEFSYHSINLTTITFVKNRFIPYSDSSKSYRSIGMSETSSDKNCCETLEWIRERVHNKKHFTARGIGQIVDVSGMDAELVVKVLAGALFAILAFSDQVRKF